VRSYSWTIDRRTCSKLSVWRRSSRCIICCAINSHLAGGRREVTTPGFEGDDQRVGLEASIEGRHLSRSGTGFPPVSLILVILFKNRCITPALMCHQRLSGAWSRLCAAEYPLHHDGGASGSKAQCNSAISSGISVFQAAYARYTWHRLSVGWVDDEFPSACLSGLGTIGMV